MLRFHPLFTAPVLLALTLLAPAASAEPTEPADPSRFRGGVGAAVGLSAPGSLMGFGLQGRFGAQFDDRYALFAEPELFWGASFFGETSGSMFCGAVTPEFEVTLADRFSIGVGPTLLFGAYAPTSGDPGFLPMPGAKLRLGVGFGSKTPDRRHQFTFAVEPRFIYSWDSGPSGFFSVALGYDAK